MILCVGSEVWGCRLLCVERGVVLCGTVCGERISFGGVGYYVW